MLSRPFAAESDDAPGSRRPVAAAFSLMEGDGTMRKFEGATFVAEEAWSGPEVAAIGSVAVKLRWTDRPYRWHVNMGQEVFAVLDGVVDMHVRIAGKVRIVTLRAGDVAHLEEGEEHVAHPRGPARILVVEDRSIR